MVRAWEKWDVDGVAEAIERLWQSGAERVHRTQLADIVARNVGSGTIALLEVGCGTGLVYEKLMDQLSNTVSYTGVDTSLNMLAIARQKFSQGLFLYGDGHELVFKDQEFEVVICFEVLGHLPDIRPVVAELLRVGSKICIFTVWPSETTEIVDRGEVIDGIQFLHKEYPDAHVREAINAGLTSPKTIRTVELAAGKNLAYLVDLQ